MTQLAAAVRHEIGTVHDRSFAGREREIREGLKSGTAFEEAQVLLGEHLGFEAGKRKRLLPPIHGGGWETSCWSLKIMQTPVPMR